MLIYFKDFFVLKAKKSFGQHFLNREDIAERIADSLSPQAKDSLVIEIGPGRGMLTKYLIDKYNQLLVIEADQDMVLFLHKHYPVLKNSIVSADFLKVDLAALSQNRDFALIGNFPYNISTQILFKMLEYKTLIPELVGMFQKEVAQRVVAPPGSKIYGVTSVLVQAFYEGEYLFSVDKGSFTPPPKVQSGVIRLRRKENYELACDVKLFKQIVKQAFGQRRKMLRNTMKSFLKDDPLLKDPFFEKRPEKLSVEDFVQLTQEVQKRIVN